jgi:hypothetical protein
VATLSGMGFGLCQMREINAVGERVRNIEKHLGFNKEIAA